MINDRLQMLPAGSLKLKGRLGKSLRLTVDNRLKKVNYKKLTETFRIHQDTDGFWRGEFWGKIVRSAIRVMQTNPDPELEKMIRKTVRDLCKTADKNGCISSYPENMRCTYWDIWGRKYALLGLLRYYRMIDQDPKVLETVRKMVRSIIKDDPFSKPPKVGPAWHDGLAAFSILGAIEIAYRLTGEKAFAKEAERLFKLGCTFSGTLFDDFAKGKRPKDLANGKAYEMTSCFEGLLELYRDTGKREYLEIVERYYQSLIHTEMMVTGTGGGRDKWGEYWYDGAENQIDPKPEYSMGETCVTATLLRFMFHLLRITGDSRYADQIEYTVYNAAMGAMKRDGSWWMHRNPTPLAGVSWKIPAGDQIKGYGEDCCLAQGPEALGVGGAAAVMLREGGLAVNFYEDMDVCTRIGSAEVKLNISGKYPAGEKITIKVSSDKKCEFTLALRIPEWCDHPVIECDGEKWECAPGRYAELKKNWQKGCKITLTLPMPITEIAAPGGAKRMAVRRGPILLVQDSRIGEVGVPVSLSGQAEKVKVKNIEDVYRWENGLQLCDYASAGNLFSEKNTLCVWMKNKKTKKS